MRRARLALAAILVAVAAGCDPAAVDEIVTAPDEAPPVLLAAGDIADCEGEADATAALVGDHPGVVAAVGDLAYPTGTREQFADCYDPTWGAERARTRPALGNHDVMTANAAGYFDYFGEELAGPQSQGWYSYDLGDWHVVVLNSNCGFAGGCGPGSAQVAWLRADLEAATAPNVLAYWHHPRYSTGQHGDTPEVQPFWDVLDAAGADVVVTAHDHDYQRYVPLDAQGEPSTGGIRQFVVGTGGAELRAFASTSPHVAYRQADHAGILRLELAECGYAWAFHAVGVHAPLDQGEHSGTC